MRQTPKLQWPYPEKHQNPWDEAFSSMLTAMDASGYAAREDRSLIVFGGGTVGFGGGVLSWSGDIKIVSPISGKILTITTGSIALADGEIAYVVLTRAPTASLTLTMQKASSLPNTDDAFALAIRSGASAYWRASSLSAVQPSVEVLPITGVISVLKESSEVTGATTTQTLPAGLSDGFVKCIFTSAAVTSCVLTITNHGSALNKVTFTSTPGSVSLVWKATANLWYITSTYNVTLSTV